MTITPSATLLDQQVWTGKIFNGTWISSTGGEYAVMESATGAQLGVIGRASLNDVQQAANQAAEAQQAWSRVSFNERARVLRRAGELWEQHAAEVMQWLIRESGSIGPKAGFELHVTANECYEAAALATQPYGRILRSEEARLSLARRLPVGVVGVISPFNVPLILSIRSVAPALALGNAVLLKPDPRTAVSGGVTLARIFFADAYVERLTAAAERLTVGDPAQEEVGLGPIIDERQRDKIHHFVTASVDAGARLTTGGHFSGPFYRPTVLTDVTPGMAAYDNEIFGPVAPVVKFSTLDEVVALARGTEYGLSLGILSKDVMKAMELAERIPSGLVHINDQTINDEPFAPFGGVGSSGNGGRLGGAEWNIEAFTETQWVTMRGQIAPH